MSRRITSAQHRLVINLWLDLKTYREINVRTGISTGAISNIINDERNKIPDLDELRDLKKSILRANTNPLDAKRGAALLEKIDELNIPIKIIPDCIKLLTQYKTEAGNVLEWGLKLMNLERTQKKPYYEIMMDAEKKAKNMQEWEEYTKKLKGQERSIKQSIREYEPLKALQNKLDHYHLTPKILDDFIVGHLRFEELGFTKETAEILATELAKKGLAPRGAAARLTKILKQHEELEEAILNLLEEQHGIEKEIERNNEELAEVRSKLSSTKNELINIEDLIIKRKKAYKLILSQVREKIDELEATQIGLREAETALYDLHIKLNKTQPLRALGKLIINPRAPTDPLTTLTVVRGLTERLIVHINEYPDIIYNIYKHTRTLETLNRQTLTNYLQEINDTLMEGIRYFARKTQ